MWQLGTPPYEYICVAVLLLHYIRYIIVQIMLFTITNATVQYVLKNLLVHIFVSFCQSCHLALNFFSVRLIGCGTTQLIECKKIRSTMGIEIFFNSTDGDVVILLCTYCATFVQEFISLNPPHIIKINHNFPIILLLPLV